MKRKIYMDHAATTQLLPEARAAMAPFLGEMYGNASTSYEPGQQAKQALEKARGQIAEAIDAEPEEIYFTSGGSEADNWAIKTLAGERKRVGGQVITSAIEHHAVLNSCAYLEKLGYQVKYLPVDKKGIVNMDVLRRSLHTRTSLISVMYGNNEIGTIEPVREIGELAHQYQIPFHTDAVQVIGQMPVSVKNSPIDLLSASGHKFHGPKGIGFLYVSRSIPIASFIHGGAQERGRRAGTENVAGAVGMACALQMAQRDMQKTGRRITALREELVGRIMREIPDTLYNGHPIERLPGNASFSFRGINATALLVLLEEAGIYASAGSACTTGSTEISHVIRRIQVPQDYAEGTIRLTLGRENTREDVLFCVKKLAESVQLLRMAE